MDGGGLLQSAGGRWRQQQGLGRRHGCGQPPLAVQACRSTHRFPLGESAQLIKQRIHLDLGSRMAAAVAVSWRQRRRRRRQRAALLRARRRVASTDAPTATALNPCSVRLAASPPGCPRSQKPADVSRMGQGGRAAPDCLSQEPQVLPCTVLLARLCRGETQANAAVENRQHWAPGMSTTSPAWAAPRPPRRHAAQPHQAAFPPPDSL